MSACVAAALAASSCSKVAETPVNPAEPEIVTIHATIPDDGTRIGLTSDGGNGLLVAWEDDDSIRIFNDEDESSEFIIKDGFTDHEAEFTGTAVSGSRYDIIYPGSCETVEEVQDILSGDFIQNGNGNTDHLRYCLNLSGVDTYQDISFTNEWAEAHGGVLYRSGVMKVVITLPDGVTTLSGVTVTLGGSEYALALKNVDVSRTDQKLTAYLMLPWNDLRFEAGTRGSIVVTDKNDAQYGIDFTFSSEKVLKAGHVSVFNIASGVEELLFAGGSGTEADPYLIGTKKHLENMMLMYKDGTEDWMKYFRMIDDVDAGGIQWTPLNYLDPYKQGIFFDGDGHTISNLEVGDAHKYASFAGVLKGTVKDVTFDGATIDGGAQKSGVVCGYLGTGDIVGNCSGVTVKNSKVSSSEFCGGFIGQAASVGTVSDCHVLKTTVIQTNDATDAQKSTGGFVGHITAAATFSGCTAQVEIKSATPKKSGVGGFAGKTHNVAPTFEECKVLSGSSITADGNWIGGFVGFAQGGGKFTSCSTAADVKVTANGQFAGGFVGYAQNVAGKYTDCSASGSVSAPVNVGGFIGCMDDGTFIGCHYDGKSVVGTNTSGHIFVGGFDGLVGGSAGGIVVDGCYVYNAAGVTISGGGNRVGGFFGQNSKNGTSGFVTTTNCYVKNATIKGGGVNTGGFVGVQYSDISTSWVEDVKVIAGDANTAAFSAFINNATLADSYAIKATVDVGAFDTAGGLTGICQPNSNIKNCFFSGDIIGSGTVVGGLAGNINSAAVTFSGCISWNASLRMAGSNANSVPLTENYAGTTGTISGHAVNFAWDTTVWDLSGDIPVLR